MSKLLATNLNVAMSLLAKKTEIFVFCLFAFFSYFGATLKREKND